MNTPSESQKTIYDSIENEWQGLFVITEHWKSNTQFIEDELSFFRSLIDKYFLWFVKDENIEKNREMLKKLIRFEKRRHTLSLKLDRHLEHMTNLMENPFPLNAQDYRDEHAKLEGAIASFSKDYRDVKREVFQLTEKIIESEKPNHLLKV